MSRKREHGRIISVETHTRGDALAEDAAAGATSITVEDAGDFDEDGGWLTIGGQVVEFSECDDDTGIILLVDPLTAAAEQGDPVQVWSNLYDEVIEYQQALVELDGEYDNPDPVAAEVAEGVGDLPEGDRGKAGESCTLKRVADDEWEVVGVGGRSRKSRGVRWEQDDFYILTADDIAAGTATFPLSRRPADEGLVLWWRTVAQEPSEYTINYDAHTITYPLSGFEAAGDRLWAHYAYLRGVSTATVEPDFGWRGIRTAGGGSTTVTSAPLPVGTQVGDTIIVLGHVGKASPPGSFAVTDSRAFSKLLDIDAPNASDGTAWSDASVWVGTATDLSDVQMVADAGNGASDTIAIIIATLGGVVNPSRIATVSSTSGVATLPAVPGSGGRGAIAVSVARYGLGTSDWSVGSPYIKAAGMGIYTAVALGYVETPEAVPSADSTWTNGARASFAVIGIGGTA